MEGWQTKRLDELCEIARGGSPRPIQDFLTNDPDGVNWIKISDATASGKYIYKTAEKIRPEGVARSRTVKPGDFLLSNSMSFGRPYIMQTTGCIHDGWLVLSDKSGLFDPDYLYYFLGSDAAYRQFDRLAAGSTVRNLNIELASRVQVLLPPLSEQKRIVAILDEAFEGIDKAIANTEKNLANARELFDATVQDVFGGAEPNWRTETLQYLLDNNWIVGHLDGNHGGDYPRKEEFVSSGVPYISANCIEGEKVDLDRAKYLRPERAARIRKGVACDGDVLFAHNATVGPVAMLRTSEPKVILGTSLTYYRCNRESLIPEYLAHYMRSPIFRRQYEQVMRQSTRNQVPITKQREFTHVVPPLDVQKSIASRLDGLDDEKRRLEDAYNGKIVRLQELKQAALARAFSGALGTSDVLTEAAE